MIRPPQKPLIGQHRRFAESSQRVESGRFQPTGRNEHPSVLRSRGRAFGDQLMLGSASRTVIASTETTHVSIPYVDPLTLVSRFSSKPQALVDQATNSFVPRRNVNLLSSPMVHRSKPVRRRPHFKPLEFFRGHHISPYMRVERV